MMFQFCPWQSSLLLTLILVDLITHHHPVCLLPPPRPLRLPEDGHGKEVVEGGSVGAVAEALLRNEREFASDLLVETLKLLLTLAWSTK